MTSVLTGKDILHVKDIKLEHISLILETASRFEQVLDLGWKIKQHGRQSTSRLVL